ncbi:hypothetical protein [Mangrovihabitans endophyticus]|uniref:DNA recombination-mediator protein A n=1 Tax=Mangrovihabitans endophyticus TaxID=1751298 RepID=A0A8J3FMC4_9ACTN|nr:hypothetical protein [Mangrovihabitans endophyticus]GGK72187.1 hypothetical protein GCM10012284_02500 [Mangrovihabitans endophyticus]
MSKRVVRVGVTGHVRLTRGSARPIYRALVDVLRAQQQHGVLHGVTCLADGADKLFARAVRDLAGTFDVVLPEPPGGARDIRRLLRRARWVLRMPAHPRPEARYAAASAEMLRQCDLLIAVWDGNPDGIHGGTAHTVARAREMGVPVRVIWPPKAKRRGHQVGGGSASHSILVPAVAASTSG